MFEIFIKEIPNIISKSSLEQYFSTILNNFKLEKSKNKGKKIPRYAFLRVYSKKDYNTILNLEHIINGHKLQLQSNQNFRKQHQLIYKRNNVHLQNVKKQYNQSSVQACNIHSGITPKSSNLIKNDFLFIKIFSNQLNNKCFVYYKIDSNNNYYASNIDSNMLINENNLQQEILNSNIYSNYRFNVSTPKNIYTTKAFH